jgi:hypothetical protein
MGSLGVLGIKRASNRMAMVAMANQVKNFMVKENNRQNPMRKAKIRL